MAMRGDGPRGLLGATDVRRMLGISEATYYRWLADGRLVGTKVGRRWRFERRAIDRLLRPTTAGAELEELRIAADISTVRLEALGWTDERLQEMRDTNVVDDDRTGNEIAQMIIEHALERQATRVHLDPVPGGLVVRERVDGSIETLDPPLPAGSREAVVQALKDRAGLDVTVESRPQEGRFLTRVADRHCAVRLSTYPGSFGESLSIALPLRANLLSIDELGFADTVKERLRSAFASRPFGLVLSVGVTGSGKSTAMYALLQELHTTGRRVMTAEEDVVVHFDGVVHAPLTAEFTVEDALRGMMRSDLDVGLVSELPSAESVRLAVEVAQTGHFVLTQMHAPDTAAALHRLLRVGGVDPDELAESLSVILAQRLMHRSCAGCKRTRRLAASEAVAVGLRGVDRRTAVPTNTGCDECKGTGRRGRIAVNEVLTMTAEVMAALARPGVTVDDLRAALAADFYAIEDDVRARLLRGEISIEVALSHIGAAVAPFNAKL